MDGSQTSDPVSAGGGGDANGGVGVRNDDDSVQGRRREGAKSDLDKKAKSRRSPKRKEHKKRQNAPRESG